MHKHLLVLFLLFSCSALAEQTTRWVDDSGKVQYSDKPAPKNARSKKVLPHVADPVVLQQPNKVLPKEAMIGRPRGSKIITEVDAVPYLKEAGRARYKDFLNHSGPRAFIVCNNGNYTTIYGDRAHDESMPSQAGKGCEVYAVDDKVVWGQ